jgi:transcriptional regulator with XRE-family HTH domain
MILILTCNNCHKTSAVSAVVETVEIPRDETWLLWTCPRCNEGHEWLVPTGRSIEDTARRSLKYSPAYARSAERQDVYERLGVESPATHGKILLGELIWWWREEAGLTQKEAARRADIGPHQWSRLEDGKNKPHAKNLQRIVQAVRGSIKQAELITGSNKTRKRDLRRRMKQLEERISPSADFQIDPKGWALHPDIESDVELTLREFRKVLPAEPHEDKFLFFAHAIHQAYWARRVGGPITIDDDRSEIIPAVNKLIDILERCKNKKAQYRVIYEMAVGAEMFMTKPEVADLVTHFLLSSFNSAAGEHETQRRIQQEWKQSLPNERLILTLFDLIDPKDQSRLIEACQKLQGSPPQTDEWFKDQD